MAGTIRIQETGESFTFDTTLDESRQDSAQVTEHPVDESLNVTDHRQPSQLVVQVTGRVTEDPLLENQSQTNASVQAVRQAATQTEPVVVDQPPARGPERIQFAQEFIQRASEAGLLTWVGAKYGTIENLLVADVTVNIVRAGHLDFEIDFQQVRIAQAKRVEVPPEAVEKPSNEPERNNCDQPVDEQYGGRDFTPAPTFTPGEPNIEQVPRTELKEAKDYLDEKVGKDTAEYFN